MTPASMLPFYNLGPPVCIFHQEANIVGGQAIGTKHGLWFAPLHHTRMMHELPGSMYALLSGNHLMTLYRRLILICDFLVGLSSPAP